MCHVLCHVPGRPIALPAHPLFRELFISAAFEPYAGVVKPLLTLVAADHGAATLRSRANLAKVDAAGRAPPLGLWAVPQPDAHAVVGRLAACALHHEAGVLAAAAQCAEGLGARLAPP